MLTVRIYNATIRRFTEILDVEYYRGSVDEANIVDFESGKESASQAVKDLIQTKVAFLFMFLLFREIA